MCMIWWHCCVIKQKNDVKDIECNRSDMTDPLLRPALVCCTLLQFMNLKVIKIELLCRDYPQVTVLDKSDLVIIMMLAMYCRLPSAWSNFDPFWIFCLFVFNKISGRESKFLNKILRQTVIQEGLDGDGGPNPSSKLNRKRKVIFAEIFISPGACRYTCTGSPSI